MKRSKKQVSRKATVRRDVTPQQVEPIEFPVGKFVKTMMPGIKRVSLNPFEGLAQTLLVHGLARVVSGQNPLDVAREQVPRAIFEIAFAFVSRVPGRRAVLESTADGYDLKFYNSDGNEVDGSA